MKVTIKHPQEVMKDLVVNMPIRERLDLDLSKQYNWETIDFTWFRAGKAETLPLESIWEREKDYIDSIYTDSNVDGQKYRALRQVDRVLVHESPESLSFDRRICYPGEILSFGSHNQNGKTSPSNGSHCVTEDEQYQVLVTSRGNAIVRTVSQYSLHTNPRIEEIALLNVGDLNAFGSNDLNILDSTRIAFLERAFDTLPRFHNVNLVTDKEHGREIRAIVPGIKNYLISQALGRAGYTKQK